MELVAGAALVVVVVATVVGAVLGLVLVGLAIGVVLAAVVAIAAYSRSEALALRLAHAQPADPERFARLHNLVEGLVIAAGLPKPAVYVVDDAAANAFATGRDSRHAAIVVTTGLLEMLNRVELEGVLAQQLSQIKNDEVLPSTLAVSLIGLPAMVVPPLFASLVPRAVGRERESAADVTAVTLTRYPPGLISALEKIEAASTVVRFNSRAIAHLWIASPYPPMHERIRVLKEL